MNSQSAAISRSQSNGVEKLRVFLTQPQLFQFWEWVRKNAPRFQSERTAFVDVAREATTTLGFVVHVSHVRAARQATGITWEPRREPNSAGARAKVGTLKRIRNVKTLATFLIQIARQLGESIPPEVQAIADEPNPR
jgi:hypothetical protein